MQSMKDIHTYKVIEAWHLFTESGILLEGVLRPEIEVSWKRSKALGLNPWGATPAPISNEELEWNLRQYADLIKIAQPMLHYISATNSQFYLDNVISLISGQGMFLSEVKKPSLNIYPVSIGTFCNEECVGTCAGAIVIKEKRPFVVGGYENYMTYLQSTFAGAAPIFKSDGDLFGLIGLFNPFGKIPEQPLEMFINAASIIQDILGKKEPHRKLAVETSPTFKNFINNAKQNILLLNSDGYIVNANDQCSDLFEISANDLIGRNYRELGIDLKLLLGVEFHPEHGNFQINLNDCSIPCLLNNCKEINGFDDLEYTLLLFSEDTTANKGRRKIANVPIDSNTLKFGDIVGSSNAFMSTIYLAQRAAQVNAPILIEGESGTGKDLIAHAIHNASQRTGPFIAINCGAIQPSLLQSELFGYEEGSFTGAVKGGKAGKFELAEGGTLFLDEIGEMSLDMQVNLLRVLQDKNVTRVGGSTAKTYDVRIIAATNVDISEAISNGAFRKDLYYRLAVIKIKLPSLRERKEDISLLASYFVKSISKKMGIDRATITPEAISILEQYEWPGNVRELSNVIENALIFTTNNKITPNLLPSTIIEETSRNTDDTKMEISEREFIIQALKLHNGNISKAAKDLGINRNTLYRRMDRLHIDR